MQSILPNDGALLKSRVGRLIYVPFTSDWLRDRLTDVPKVSCHRPRQYSSSVSWHDGSTISDATPNYDDDGDGDKGDWEMDVKWEDAKLKWKHIQSNNERKRKINLAWTRSVAFEWTTALVDSYAR